MNTTTTTPGSTGLGAPSTEEEALAQTLLEALNRRTPLQVSDYAHAVADLDSAYRVQHRLTQLKGEPVAGYKVSLTSEQTQHMFDATEPLYGAQVASRVRAAPLTLHPADVMAPLVEVELNFRVLNPLGAEATVESVFESTTVAAGLEVPDSRFADWFPDLPKELVGSDAAVGGYLVYGQEAPTATAFSAPDELSEVHAVLTHDGEHVREGGSSEVLGNPLNAVVWLAQALDRHGLGGLRPGQRVSSGTFVLPPALTAGTWTASYDHGLGDVSVTLARG
jgi:2-oxo-hept-3-ene-1,7-dioate hydratase